MDDTYGTEYEEFHETFLEMEADLDLFSYTIDGVPIWERIRLDVVRAILHELDIWGQPHTQIDPSVWEYLGSLGKFAKHAVTANPYLSDEHDLLYWGHCRRKLRDGAWWDIYCDPIHETGAFDYLHVEEPYLNDHLTPAKTENLRYLDVIEYTGFLRRKAGLVDVSLSASDERWTATLRRRIRDEFGGGDEAVENHVRHQLALRASTKGLYGRLVDAVDPDVAILVVSNGKETFIEACQERSIPVVELQHGDINWYSYEYSFPGDRTKEAFPDYVFTFGEFWNDRAEYPIDRDQVIDVGYPYLEAKLEGVDVSGEDDRDQVVFVSNGASGGAMSRVAAELSRIEDRGIDIVYQLHPGEYERWREEYPHLVGADLEVVDSNEPSLYQVFEESTVQVGTNSTATYEGLAFGLDTYLLKTPSVEWMRPLVERGDATFVTSAEEIVAQLRESREPTQPSQQYFEPNAVQNIVEAIREIRTDSR